MAQSPTTALCSGSPEPTGGPRGDTALTWAFLDANGAVRSGGDVPARVFRVPCPGPPGGQGREPRPHRGGTHVMARLPPLRGQAARTVTGPAPGRQRLTTRRRLHAGIDGLEERRGLHGAELTPGPMASPTARSGTRVRPVGQRLVAPPSRAGGPSCGPADRRHAPMPQPALLGRLRPAARACVPRGLERLLGRVDRLCLGVGDQARPYRPRTTRGSTIKPMSSLFTAPKASHAPGYGASLIYSRWVKKPVILPGKVYSAIYLGFTPASACNQNMGISANSLNL